MPFCKKANSRHDRFHRRIGRLSFCIDVASGLAHREAGPALRRAVKSLALPLSACLFAVVAALYHLPATVNMLATIALIASAGPVFYRLVYRPISGASVLVLLIVSVALHLALLGLGLYFFGPQGGHSAPLANLAFSLGGRPHSGANRNHRPQRRLFLLPCSSRPRSGRLYGKALRAAAVNPIGARLMGISASLSGEIAFAIAAAIGAICGVLVSGMTTIYYDTGFFAGPQGASSRRSSARSSASPLLPWAPWMLGLFESFSSFFASAFKEVIVFSLIIPILVWRSLRNSENEE